MYTAELKRPVKESKSSKKAAVDGLIDDLGLEACRNVRIGNSMARGISGGQVRTACGDAARGRSPLDLLIASVNTHASAEVR